MIGPGDDDSGKGGKGSENGERFADLIGDARPLERGPTRVEPPRGRARATGRAAAGGSDEGAQGAGSRFRWPDPEDRHRAAASGVSDAQIVALARGDHEPDERIELHGARRDSARRLVAKRIESAAAQGLRCVVVIHGQGQRSATGEAILRDALPDWLANGPAARFVLAFAPAPNRLGGLGATLVLLRSR